MGIRVLSLLMALSAAASAQAETFSVQVTGDVGGTPFLLRYLADADLGVVAARNDDGSSTTYAGAVLGRPFLRVGEKEMLLEGGRFSIVNGRRPDSPSPRTLDQFGFNASTADGARFGFTLVSGEADTITSTTTLFVAPRLQDFLSGVAAFTATDTVLRGKVREVSIAAVPEPAAVGILGLALLGIALRYRSRRS